MNFVAPSIREVAFNCPYCQAFAHQLWFTITTRRLPKETAALDAFLNSASYVQKEELELFPLKIAQSDVGITSSLASKCASCNKVAIWVNDKIVYPSRGSAPLANSDMPEDIRKDYEEASSILEQSPRGAAALIRLAIQKLCKHLGQPGKNINDDIGALVKSGLDPRVQKALDAVRVIGNSAVHPGQIDLRDDKAIAETLFKLVNLVVEKTITEPKHVSEIYSSLPEGALKAIERRDGTE